MRPNQYLIALFTLEISSDETIREAKDYIKYYIDDLYKERDYLCSRIAQLTKSRDEYKKELNDLEEQPCK